MTASRSLGEYMADLGAPFVAAPEAPDRSVSPDGPSTPTAAEVLRTLAESATSTPCPAQPCDVRIPRTTSFVPIGRDLYQVVRAVDLDVAARAPAQRPRRAPAGPAVGGVVIPTYEVHLDTAIGPAVLHVPTLLGADAAARRAKWTAVAAGWGDVDDVHVTSSELLEVAPC